MEATKEHEVIHDIAMFVTMLNVDSTDDFTLHEFKFCCLHHKIQSGPSLCISHLISHTELQELHISLCPPLHLLLG